MSDNDVNLFPPDERPFLSKVIAFNQLKKGQANVIVAPCHSGKTTAAKEIFEKHRALSSSGLLLIDTTAGRDSLLKHQKAQRTPAEIAEILNPYTIAANARNDVFITMTYYEFGIYARYAPEVFNQIKVIVCDEMHNLVHYLAIEEARNKKDDPEGILAELGGCDQEYAYALNYLSRQTSSTHSDDPLIVIMTAPPNCPYRKFAELKTPYAVFDYTNKVRCDRTANICHYAHFKSLIQQIDKRAIIYVPTIKLIQEFSTLADDGNRKIISLWSTHNKDHPMSDIQLAVRTEILTSELIPADIDLLFLNAAYETSINIRNDDFNTIIIRTCNPDAQIQARGRLRHDIQDMYLYDSSHEHISEYFPKEYLGVPLSAADRKQIAQNMALVNSKGRPLKWSSIAAALLRNGHQITESRRMNHRFYSVHPLIESLSA